jgi:hypothetical protein
MSLLSTVDMTQPWQQYRYRPKSLPSSHKSPALKFETCSRGLNHGSGQYVLYTHLGHRTCIVVIAPLYSSSKAGHYSHKNWIHALSAIPDTFSGTRHWPLQPHPTTPTEKIFVDYVLLGKERLYCAVTPA